MKLTERKLRQIIKEELQSLNENRYQKVADTIYKQLGGRRLGMMVKIKTMYYTENGRGGLHIYFSNRGGPNRVEITLNHNDLYDVEFMKQWGDNLKTTKTYNGVYADMLQDIFEDETGLYVRL